MTRLPSLVRSAIVPCLLVPLIAACGGGGSNVVGPGGGAGPALLIVPQNPSGAWIGSFSSAGCVGSDGLTGLSFEFEGAIAIQLAGTALLIDLGFDTGGGYLLEGTYDTSSGTFDVAGGAGPGYAVRLHGSLRAVETITGYVFALDSSEATFLDDGMDPDDPLASCLGEPQPLEFRAMASALAPADADVTGSWSIRCEVLDTFGTSLTPALRECSLVQTGMFLQGASLTDAGAPIHGLLNPDGADASFGCEIDPTRGWLISYFTDGIRMTGEGLDFLYAEAGDEVPVAATRFVFEGVRVQPSPPLAVHEGEGPGPTLETEPAACCDAQLPRPRANERSGTNR